MYSNIGERNYDVVLTDLRLPGIDGLDLVARLRRSHSRLPVILMTAHGTTEAAIEATKRGAFTGAESRRIGRFEQADGGTLFLDEIGDMTPGTQVKLLRVLQEKTIQRVGGKELIPVDVRIIAATHRDLEVAVAEKEFREDLLYRINVVTLTLPPLEKRPDDIPALVSYFLHRHGADLGVEEPAIRAEALSLLRQHAWPGTCAS